MIKNKYYHLIDLKKIKIRNCQRDKFAQSIIDIDYRGYEVEQLCDGRKIVITKPGGKRAFGRPYKEDIQVFIYDPLDNSLWQISHTQIFEDLSAKFSEDKKQGLTLFNLFERTYNGEEPDDFIDEIKSLHFNTGEAPETLIKAYKWIWGQEDVNYSKKLGRAMSWEMIVDLKKRLLD